MDACRDALYRKQWRAALKYAASTLQAHYVLGHMLEDRTTLPKGDGYKGFLSAEAEGNGNGDSAGWWDGDGTGDGSGDGWGDGGGCGWPSSNGDGSGDGECAGRIIGWGNS